METVGVRLGPEVGVWLGVEVNVGVIVAGTGVTVEDGLSVAVELAVGVAVSLGMAPTVSMDSVAVDPSVFTTVNAGLQAETRKIKNGMMIAFFMLLQVRCFYRF
jgi:hypothetical protein